MELNQLIEQLLKSGIIENQELGVTLLRSPDVSYEEKKHYIDNFIKEYTQGKVDFFNEEHSDVFKAWVELYGAVMKDDIKKQDKNDST